MATTRPAARPPVRRTTSTSDGGDDSGRSSAISRATSARTRRFAARMRRRCALGHHRGTRIAASTSPRPAADDASSTGTRSGVGSPAHTGSALRRPTSQVTSTGSNGRPASPASASRIARSTRSCLARTPAGFITRPMASRTAIHSRTSSSVRSRPPSSRSGLGTESRLVRTSSRRTSAGSFSTTAWLPIRNTSPYRCTHSRR
ncbi:hypothetical protein [Saccharothrix syringae]|uniref:hypothetical protein n=1 Tax=Saccharothrix syringae TaxID=103733 RepID=UPI0005253E7F|nr:hypothetical protein [Saccharothrix syringae]